MSKNNEENIADKQEDKNGDFLNGNLDMIDGGVYHPSKVLVSEYIYDKDHKVCGELIYHYGGDDDYWLESETQYKDGKKHGFEKLYNSDGTVAEMKYWQNGKDCTEHYNKLKNKLKRIATKRIDKEKAIEAETGVKTRLPKMSKGAKVVAMVKESIGLSK